MSSFSIWSCVLKGCFERGIFRRAKSRSKDIDDFFNIQHYSGLSLAGGMGVVLGMVGPVGPVGCPWWGRLLLLFT